MTKYLKRSEIDALLNRKEPVPINEAEVKLLQKAIAEEEKRLGIEGGTLKFEAIQALKKKLGLEHITLLNTKGLK